MNTDNLFKPFSLKSKEWVNYGSDVAVFCQ